MSTRINFDISMLQPVNGQPEYYYFKNANTLACRPDHEKRERKYFQQNGDLKAIYTKIFRPEAKVSFGCSKTSTVEGFNNLKKRLEIIDQKMVKSNSKWGFFSKLIARIWNFVFPENKIEYTEYNTKAIKTLIEQVTKAAVEKQTNSTATPVANPEQPTSTPVTSTKNSTPVTTKSFVLDTAPRSNKENTTNSSKLVEGKMYIKDRTPRILPNPRVRKALAQTTNIVIYEEIKNGK